MPRNAPPKPDFYVRFVTERVEQALEDTGVVLLIGPRQAGKTTLARLLAHPGRRFLSLDDVSILNAAQQDPKGFIRGLDRAVIDEIQRAPELLLAIKQSIDDDDRAGRFLLTGSANVLVLPKVADSLAGRVASIRLLPLAQCELLGQPCTFLESVFAGRVPRPVVSKTGVALVRMVLAGGYPRALRRPQASRRARWYTDYLDTMVQRDVREVSAIEHLQQLPLLLQVLGHHAGQLTNRTELGAAIGLNHVTAGKYLGVLDNLFLTYPLAGWHGNALSRLAKRSKVYFYDTGLLAALLEVDERRVRTNRKCFGPLLENFVVAELLRLATWTQMRLRFTYFRDSNNNEVDIVIEDGQGRIVAIEVKARATIKSTDFNGIRRLTSLCGDRLVLGLVLHDSDEVIPFGERLYAAPVSTLWSTAHMSE